MKEDKMPENEVFKNGKREWNEAELYVMDKLDALSRDIGGLTSKIDQIVPRVSYLQGKIAGWGAAGGAVVTIAGLVIKYLTESKSP
jgi:hypothetical protein